MKREGNGGKRAGHDEDEAEDEAKARREGKRRGSGG